MPIAATRQTVQMNDSIPTDERIIVVLQSTIDNSISEVSFDMSDYGRIAYSVNKMLHSARYKNHTMRQLYSFTPQKNDIA